MTNRICAVIFIIIYLCLNLSVVSAVQPTLDTIERELVADIPSSLLVLAILAWGER